MLIDSFIVGIIVALLRGGKFRELLNVQIKCLFLVILAFLIQNAAILFFSNFLLTSVLISYCLLLIFSIMNRRAPGFVLISIGIFLNLVVMAANSGHMPVEASTISGISPDKLQALIGNNAGKHILMTGSTNLNFLGDIFYLHAPYPHQVVISLGDILFSIGVFTFIQKIMVKRRPPMLGSVINEK